MKGQSSCRSPQFGDKDVFSNNRATDCQLQLIDIQGKCRYHHDKSQQPADLPDAMGLKREEEIEMADSVLIFGKST